MRPLILPVLAFAVGCGPALRDLPVRAVSAETTHERTEVCPGQRVHLTAAAELTDGRTLTTAEGEGVDWSAYDVEVEGVAFDGEGYVIVDRAPGARERVEVRVRALEHPFESELSLPIT